MSTDALNQALTDIGEIVRRIWELHYTPEGDDAPAAESEVEIAIDSVCEAYRMLAEGGLKVPKPIVTTGGGGEVRLEWHRGDAEVVLEVGPNEYHVFASRPGTSSKYHRDRNVETNLFRKLKNFVAWKASK